MDQLLAIILAAPFNDHEKLEVLAAIHRDWPRMEVSIERRCCVEVLRQKGILAHEGRSTFQLHEALKRLES